MAGERGEATGDGGDGAVRKIASYRGRVQGVGFRATTAMIARRQASVTGFVRNEPDGSVHLEAQGRAADVDAFLGEVANAMRGNIQGSDVHEAPTVDGESSFRVER